MLDPSPVSPQSETTADSEVAFLLEYLKTHDAFCPLCQYNLRNLTIPRCPECGRAIRLTVGMVEPYLLPWVLGTVFTAMAAGIGFIFVLAWLLYGPPHLRVDDFRSGMVCLVLTFCICAMPLTLALVVARRRFFACRARRSGPLQAA
jgi:hypothetical protein